MVEIPTKNAAAYKTLFQNLGQFALKNNDKPGVDSNPSADVVELQTTSKAMYSSGDEVRLLARLQNGTVQALQVEVQGSDRDPYRASLKLEQTEAGLVGSELLHNGRGLSERSFSIQGEAVTVSQESRSDKPFEPQDSREKERMGQELGYMTGSLQYLLGPKF